MAFQSFSRLLMAAAVCTVLTACSDSAPSNSTPPSSDKQASSASTTGTSNIPQVNLPANAPVVTVVTTGKTRPFSYTEKNGSVAGLDIDVISKIGEAQGFRVQVHKRPWQNLFTDVEAGHYQIAISGISFTPERAEKYNLSQSYALNPSILMYTNGDYTSKIKDLKSLKNIPQVSVGVLDGSKHMKQMTEAGVRNLKTYKTTYLLFGGLLKDEVNVIAQDGLLLQQMAKEHAQGKQIHTFTYEKSEEPSAQLVVLMRKDNTELLQKVNEGLDKIKANGELAKIHAKWLVSDNDDAPATPTATSSTAASAQ